MFIVRCTRCKQDQKCQPKAGLVTQKKKHCVYCGCTFKIHTDLEKSRIVRTI